MHVTMKDLTGRNGEDVNWGWHLGFPLKERIFQQVGKVGKPLDHLKAVASPRCD